jgi:hypothetical protein
MNKKLKKKEIFILPIDFIKKKNKMRLVSRMDIINKENPRYR